MRRIFDILLIGFILFTLVMARDIYAFKIYKTQRGFDVKWHPKVSTIVNPSGGVYTYSDSPEVSYYFNPSGAKVGALAALRASMGTWTGVETADFTVVYKGITSNSEYGTLDYQNIITFGPLDIYTLALNTVWYYSGTGKIVDSDIQFNIVYNWTTNGSPGTFDLQNIATHELGHTLFLGDLYGSSDREKTMYGYGEPGETKKRTLHQDDINGITYLYPRFSNQRWFIFTSMDYPNAVETMIYDINNSGQTVGAYIDAGGECHGFFHDGTTFTSIDYPDAEETRAYGLNEGGEIVGQYADAGGLVHGFLYDGTGFTSIDHPDATETMAYGINDSGQIVGSYYFYNYDVTEEEIHCGFLYDGAGFTIIFHSGATKTMAYDINDSGRIVGGYYDASGEQHGFLYDVLYDGTSVSLFDYPGGGDTVVLGINQAGAITGSYGGGDEHGFFYSKTTLTTMDYPDAYNTVLWRANDNDQMVGWYTDKNGRKHGFLANKETFHVDVKANDLDGPVFVNPVEPVAISLSISPGDMTGKEADWWGFLLSSYGAFPLFSFKAPLVQVPETTLLNMPWPLGWYVFLFVLDNAPDGAFELDWYDYVIVVSLPAGAGLEDIPDLE